MSLQGNQGSGAKLAKDHSNAIKELEKMLAESPSPERASAKLAQMLNVARNEVAVLRLEKGSLRFVHPPELRVAGVIPVSSSAVAARTAATGTSLLSNSFARMKHVSLFESVRLGGKDDNRATVVTRANAEALGVLSKRDLADRILDRIVSLYRK